MFLYGDEDSIIGEPISTHPRYLWFAITTARLWRRSALSFVEKKHLDHGEKAETTWALQVVLKLTIYNKAESVRKDRVNRCFEDMVRAAFRTVASS